MPNLHDAALMLVRLFAWCNLVIGVSLLIAVALISVSAVAIGGEPKDLLLGIIGYMMDYGFCAALGGVVLLTMSRKIARYASKG